MSIVVDEISPEEEDIGTEEIEEVKAEPEIPEKYRGKSMEDIVQMHQEAEKKMSHQGQELGQARKLADQLLQAELNRSKPKEEEAVDWEYDTQKATENLVTTAVGSVKSEVDQIKQKLEISEFIKQHPDLTKDAATPEYQEWITKSAYRTKLHNSNVEGFNLDMAEELASAWEEHKSIPKSDDKQEKRQKELKAASLETGNSSTPSSKKIWSRATIRNMRLYEPNKFEEHRDEITRAYNEGRTKP